MVEDKKRLVVTLANKTVPSSVTFFLFLFSQSFALTLKMWEIDKSRDISCSKMIYLNFEIQKSYCRRQCNVERDECCPFRAASRLYHPRVLPPRSRGGGPHWLDKLRPVKREKSSLKLWLPHWVCLGSFTSCASVVSFLFCTETFRSSSCRLPKDDTEYMMSYLRLIFAVLRSFGICREAKC